MISTILKLTQNLKVQSPSSLLFSWLESQEGNERKKRRYNREQSRNLKFREGEY